MFEEFVELVRVMLWVISVWLRVTLEASKYTRSAILRTERVNTEEVLFYVEGVILFLTVLDPWFTLKFVVEKGRDKWDCLR